MPASATPTRRHRHRPLRTTAALALLVGTAVTPAPDPARAEGTALPAGDYIVTLSEPPAATYGGGVPGIDATRPGHGDHLEPTDPDVRAYRKHLREGQRDLATALGVRPTSSYTVGINGFSARLSAEQAARLSTARGVRVVRDVLHRPAGTRMPLDHLGLTGPGGAWERLGGRDRAGRGVVVGVLDGGVWPENPFFAGEPVTSTTPSTEPGATYRTTGGEIAVARADGGTFVGRCEEGENFPATTCNSKIVSARLFSSGFLAASATGLPPGEYDSSRDANGHGSHVASLAAGGAVADTVVGASSLGPSSGVAPEAKIAVYKVCFHGRTSQQTGCAVSDSIAAVEQAITDGVDVINYSVGGDTPDDATSLLERAFLSAATAGVVVVTAAGNSGPTPGSVDRNTPWVISVGAADVHRFENTLALGDGSRVRGDSLNTVPLPPTRLVLASRASLDGVSPVTAPLCRTGALDPELVAGAVVACRYAPGPPTVPIPNKAAEVARVGGVGMVLLDAPETLSTLEATAVPTLYLAEGHTAAVTAHADSVSPTAEFLVGDVTGTPPAPLPVVHRRSARGPSDVDGGDLLKPDLTAPGVNLLGAALPPGWTKGSAGDRVAFGPLTGTSMAAGVTSGAAALLLSEHPTWSPMAVRSALMTSAAQTLRTPGGSPETDPFVQGAGLLDPGAALDPGLVYDAGHEDWMSYLEGLGLATGSGAPPVDPSDHNSPSVAVGELPGSQTITRTVTSTGPGTYEASASLPGTEVTVSPRVLTFARAGERRSFTLRIERTTAPLDRYTTGALVWSGEQRTVRSPLAVRPVGVALPREVGGRLDSGSTSFTVGLGGGENLGGGEGPTARVAGLVPADVTTGELATGPLAALRGTNEATHVHRITVPDGAVLVRVELAATDPSDDFDLYVHRPDGTRATSGRPGSDERVDLEEPAPGTHVVQVHAYATSGGRGTYTLRSYTVGPEDAGNLRVSPDPVQGPVGSSVRVTARWSGLRAGTSYLGTITYPGATHPLVLTVR